MTWRPYEEAECRNCGRRITREGDSPWTHLVSRAPECHPWTIAEPVRS